MKIINVQKQIFTENGFQKSKKSNIINPSAAAASFGVVTAGLGFVLKDTLIDRKNYIKQIKNENDSYEKKVEEKLAKSISKRISIGEAVDQEDIDITRDVLKSTLSSDLDRGLEAIKVNRKSILKQNIKIFSGIGISLSVLGIVLNNYIESQKKNNNSNEVSNQVSISTSVIKNSTSVLVNNQTNLIKQHQLANQSKINFTGIIDEIGHELSYSIREDVKNYINGKNISYEEQKMADRIAAHNLKRDWPKGVPADSIYVKYYWMNPKADSEYHKILLEQEIKVPVKPPKYYSIYDALFETQRWKDHQKWPEYIEKSMKFERMENLIKKVYLENLAKEKLRLEVEAKQQIVSAYTKYRLNKEFLADFTSVENQASIPKAIMIEGLNREENRNNLKWLVGKTNANYIYIEDTKDKSQVRYNQIISALEKAQENFDKNGKRTILWVENFGNLLINNDENEEINADLKELILNLNEKYKTTLIFEAASSKSMDPIALQPHRVKVLNTNKEVPLSEFKKLKDEFLKSNIRPIQGSDGYRFNYLLTNKDFVDLYLGSFGYNSEVLWIDSTNNEKIQVVLENANIIKSVPKFKNIKKIQCSCPEKLDEVKSLLKCTYNRTQDWKYIYEYDIESAK